MLNDAISTAFFATVKYKQAPLHSKEENIFYSLKAFALENLEKNCRSYSEYRRIKAHIDLLTDMKVWPVLCQRGDNCKYLIDANINRKGIW